MDHRSSPISPEIPPTQWENLLLSTRQVVLNFIELSTNIDPRDYVPDLPVIDSDSDEILSSLEDSYPASVLARSLSRQQSAPAFSPAVHSACLVPVDSEECHSLNSSQRFHVLSKVDRHDILLHVTSPSVSEEVETDQGHQRRESGISFSSSSDEQLNFSEEPTSPQEDLDSEDLLRAPAVSSSSSSGHSPGLSPCHIPEDMDMVDPLRYRRQRSPSLADLSQPLVSAVQEQLRNMKHECQTEVCHVTSEEIAERIAELGDRIMAEYGPQFNEAMKTLFENSSSGLITYTMFRDIATQFLVDMPLTGWDRVALLFCFSRQTAYGILKKGGRSFKDLFDYGTYLVGDVAGEFIISQGGWDSIARVACEGTEGSDVICNTSVSVQTTTTTTTTHTVSPVHQTDVDQSATCSTVHHQYCRTMTLVRDGVGGLQSPPRGGEVSSLVHDMPETRQLEMPSFTTETTVAIDGGSSTLGTNLGSLAQYSPHSLDSDDDKTPTNLKSADNTPENLAENVTIFSFDDCNVAPSSGGGIERGEKPGAGGIQKMASFDDADSDCSQDATMLSAHSRSNLGSTAELSKSESSFYSCMGEFTPDAKLSQEDISRGEQDTPSLEDGSLNLTAENEPAENTLSTFHDEPDDGIVQPRINTENISTLNDNDINTDTTNTNQFTSIPADGVAREITQNEPETGHMTEVSYFHWPWYAIAFIGCATLAYVVKVRYAG